MTQILQTLQAWLATRHDERGATAVEYGMIVALIAAIIVGVVGLLGLNVLQAFTDVNNAF